MGVKEIERTRESVRPGLMIDGLTCPHCYQILDNVDYYLHIHLCKKCDQEYEI
jgi:hypothetical protein